MKTALGALLITCHLGAQDLDRVLREALPLTGTVVLDADSLDLRTTHLLPLGTRGLVLASNPDKRVKFFDFADQSLKTIIRDGEGPGEVRGGLVQLSVLGEELFVQEIAGAYKVFRLNGESRVVSGLPWNVRGAIKVGDHLVCAVITSPGSTYFSKNLEEKTVPNHTAAIFETGGEKGTWNLLGTFGEDDIMHDEGADLEFGIRTNLFNIAGTGTFYRIPYFASPAYQIMDHSSQTLRELAIPHPFAARVPKSPFARLEKIKQGYRLRLIRCAAVDRRARVYFLLTNVARTDAAGGSESIADRVLVQVDPDGRPQRAFLTGRPLKLIAVDPLGVGLYGIDAEEDQLIKFPLPDA